MEKQDISEANSEDQSSSEEEQTKFDLDERISQLSQQRDGLEKEISILQRERDRLHISEYRDGTSKSDTEARMEYIRKQAEIRGLRRARQVEALKGINPKDLDPRSPVDQAMSRKNQRGTERPKREPPPKE